MDHHAHLVNQVSLAFGRYKSLSLAPATIPAVRGQPNRPLEYARRPGELLSRHLFYGNSSCPRGVGSRSPATRRATTKTRKSNNTYTAADNLQWQRGKHSVTFGGQVVEVQFNYIKNLTYSSPLTYTFSTRKRKAIPLREPLVTRPAPRCELHAGRSQLSSVTVGVPGLGSRWHDPSFWVQDDYKITPKLTIERRPALGYLPLDPRGCTICSPG